MIVGYFVIFIGAVAAPILAATNKYYATRYDHIDVDSILNNRRIVNNYAACLLGQGPCPPQGLELKRILPEALHTNCARCTEKQKTVAYLSMKRLRKEYPKVWQQLAKRWDPDGLYIQRFEMEFKNSANRGSTSTTVTPPTIGSTFPTMKSTSSFAPSTADLGSTWKVPTISSTRPPPQIFPIIANRFPEFMTTSHSSSSSSSFNMNSFGSTDAVVASTSQSTTVKNPTKWTSTTKKTDWRRRPIDRIGANIKATVSLGTNIMGEVIRGLGELGDKVVETGSKLAGAVISVVTGF